MMKMVMAVVARDQADPVLNALISEGHIATFTESRGGFLRQAQHMLFMAVEEEKLEEVLALIRAHCRGEVRVQSEGGGMLSPGLRPASAEVGGAVIFVWPLERFEIY
ncbi:MAG: cyclic-di-AMP receptor [Anaerolineae bacterium]